MRMPEATMNKDDLAVLGQNDVRPSRQVLAMKPEAVPHGVKYAPDSELRAGVFAFDRLHYAAALLRAACVHARKVRLGAGFLKTFCSAAYDLLPLRPSGCGLGSGCLCVGTDPFKPSAETIMHLIGVARNVDQRRQVRQVGATRH